jgi:hypothetical protein
LLAGAEIAVSSEVPSALALVVAGAQLVVVAVMSAGVGVPMQCRARAVKKAPAK